MKANLAFGDPRMQAVGMVGGGSWPEDDGADGGPLTVDDVQGDGVRFGVRGRARELAGVPQVGAGDP